jgi:hypothetical protein
MVRGWTIMLGDNEIADCDAALVVEDLEVFRLRERQHDGQLVVDFDLRDANDNRIAKIAKNHVVFTAEHFEPRSSPGIYQVVNKQSGQVWAKVQEISPSVIKVTGTFCVRGFQIIIQDDLLQIGGGRLGGNKLVGFGKAIVLKRGGLGIGFTG